MLLLGAGNADRPLHIGVYVKPAALQDVLILRLLGVSLRTIIRWERGTSAIAYENLLKLMALARAHEEPELVPIFVASCPEELLSLFDLNRFFTIPTGHLHIGHLHPLVTKARAESVAASVREQESQ